MFERKKCLRSFSSSNAGSTLILDDEGEDDDEENFLEDHERNVLDALMEGSKSMMEEECPVFGDDVNKRCHQNCKTVSEEIRYTQFCSSSLERQTAWLVELSSTCRRTLSCD